MSNWQYLECEFFFNPKISKSVSQSHFQWPHFSVNSAFCLLGFFSFFFFPVAFPLSFFHLDFLRHKSNWEKVDKRARERGVRRPRPCRGGSPVRPNPGAQPHTLSSLPGFMPGELSRDRVGKWGISFAPPWSYLHPHDWLVKFQRHSGGLKLQLWMANL